MDHRGDNDELHKLLTSSNVVYSVFQGMKEGLVITDINANILNVNQAYCSITGYSVQELIGRNLNIIKSNLHDQAFYRELWKRITSEGRWEGEIWNRHKCGRLFLQKLSIIAIRDKQDTINQYVGVVSDISEEEKLRKDIVRTGMLQRTLLPSAMNIKMLEIDTVFRPLNYLGGDFFDYYWDSEKRILSGYIIDIMGHGVTASFQNSVLRVLFRQNFDHNRTLVEILKTINQESMSYFLEDTFAAALCFRINLEDGLFTYACAGINKFIKCQTNGEINVIKQPGPYLGILSDPTFDEITEEIKMGELLFFMTDGFMDIFEMNNRLYANDLKGNMNMLRRMSISELKDDASAIGVLVKQVGGG
ncbi:SpoIIE family protein phosphatase [Cytobacillus praedii]|uniref:PAS domain S-box protein n=1 Tax=Cytobacillus praedii TaxID=1742358 RepID=A0A4R1AWZ1_9BACI|nr:SpoIIE family protein phosphatase [Cytobacillus praedii]TCJ02785.1 PAS domain S-box protein [Cytobacillus praedii]